MTEKKVSPGRPKIRPECKPVNFRLSLQTIVLMAKIGKKTGEKSRTEIIERLIKEEWEKLNNAKDQGTDTRPNQPIFTTIRDDER
jgi:hypothetical protein